MTEMIIQPIFNHDTSNLQELSLAFLSFIMLLLIIRVVLPWALSFSIV